ncbi:hypothetical protein, partial [Parabacteroides distasonis]|uniref:hypothetical protein n=1 Tax=Parabacteroides distasonis TaxID=823 RepID=UPI00232EA144
MKTKAFGTLPARRNVSPLCLSHDGPPLKSIATFTPLIERVLSWNLLPAISGIVSSVWSLFHVLASPV